jgi:hypothetical protein
LRDKPCAAQHCVIEMRRHGKNLSGHDTCADVFPIRSRKTAGE